MFRELPYTPDHQALEHTVLQRWEDERTFDRLREQNSEGPRFSFIDGPVTANKSLGVHTAWGRALKDVFQRYKALRGHNQRYQNGFDCQGLWIEVGVERDLGLNSKQAIEDFGLERFARKCREVVEWSARELTRGSIRLGMWMDWGKDYFTFSDTNIEYIWRFLQIVHDRGWLYKGHRATEWCPRCGTSLSAHELTGSYADREDTALSVRLPLKGRDGEALVAWTTTSWTLPANVAAAVHPDAQYARTPEGHWMATTRLPEGVEPEETVRGAELVGLRYEAPFDHIGLGGEVDHRVVAWDDVALDNGTGVVHIAPGCGTEDFELGLREGLDVIVPVDEAGRFLAKFGWLAGRGAHEVADEIVADLDERGFLVHAERITHRYPKCWRCNTPLIFRLTDDWFIAVEDIREQMRVANSEVDWTPEYLGKRVDDWLVNMGDWNISRRRYYGLPLPFYPCNCGEITVVGSKAELAELAIEPLDAIEELHRPWIDRVRISCPACKQPVDRVEEVGDVWLDAGIVPFSTLGWQSSEYVPNGYATGAAEGLTAADLPDHSYWEQWFPADWVSEMSEQVRLWFYAQLFMSVVLTGSAPYRRVLGYEKMRDETGREMHGSWGNVVDAQDAFERMGADVMRWQYCTQPPSHDLHFGFGPGEKIQRKLLTLWNTASFFVQYANIEGFVPLLAWFDDGPPPSAHQVDRWLVARTRSAIDEVTRAYESYMTVDVLRAYESYIGDVSNWYVRTSRRRFWDGDTDALATLWWSIVTSLRTISPILPFLAEDLWDRLVADVCPDARSSVFLAGWPVAGVPDKELLEDMANVRAIVDLGRQARAAAGIRTRQPLNRVVVEGAESVSAYGWLIANELRVEKAEFADIEATELRVKPNFPVLGPRLGAGMKKVKEALDAGHFEQLSSGGYRVAGYQLAPDDVVLERVDKVGWEVVSALGVSVALDTAVSERLEFLGKVNDLIHDVNTRRREMGLELTDRIRLAVPLGTAELEDAGARIAAETLAVDVIAADGPDIRIEKVASTARI